MIQHKKKIIGIFFILLSAFLVSSGQFFWKISNNSNNIFGLITFGFVLYAVGALFMIFALKNGSLSTLYPLMATGYIFASIYSVLILKESFSSIQILGIGFVLTGSILLGKSK